MDASPLLASLNDAQYFTRLSGADLRALTRIMRTLAATHGVAALPRR